MNPVTMRTLLVFILLGFVLVRNLRGFLHFVLPGKVRYRIEGHEVSSTDPALRQMIREVEGLDFRPLGTLTEHRLLSPVVRQFVFADVARREFAVVFPKGREAWLYFLTVPDPRTFVFTADHRFPSSDSKGFVTGGLAGASPEEVLAAHRRRVDSMESEAEPSGGAVDLPSYVETALAFHGQGPGKNEIRRKSTRGFMFASAAIAWGALTLWKVLSTP